MSDDRWWCWQCKKLVDQLHNQHRTTHKYMAHDPLVWIEGDIAAAICAEQREKDAQKIAKHLGGMVATHIWLSLDSLLMDIREGKEE